MSGLTPAELFCVRMIRLSVSFAYLLFYSFCLLR